MPFIPADWLGSTQVALMSLAEQGAYLRLLCHAWGDENCCLPDDDAMLARLSGLNEEWGKSSGAVLRRCFTPDPERPGKIFNERQRRTREEQHERISARHRSAKAGAKAKWGPAQDSRAPHPEPTSMESASDQHSVSIQTASGQHMLIDASSPVTPPPSPVPQREREREGVPPSFPSTREEAVKAAHEVPGCTPEFAAQVWQEAADRGGRDMHGEAIFSWVKYLSGRVAAVNRRKTKHGRWQHNDAPPCQPNHQKGFF